MTRAEEWGAFVGMLQKYVAGVRDPALRREVAFMIQSFGEQAKILGASVAGAEVVQGPAPRLGSDFVRPPPLPVVVQPVPPAPAAGPVRRRIVEPAPLLPRGKVGPVVRPVPPREYRPTEREREQARARAEAEKALAAEREREESPAPAVDGGGDEVTAAE